jgi:GNAT superfamily N-acetyltransferase
MLIRRARPGESDVLTSLAFAAKAFWGYTRQQLDAWSAELQISPESITQEPTFVAEVQGRVLGVAQLDTSSTPWQIECLWVHPESVRQGLGTRLLRKAMAWARTHGQVELHIDADPHAEGFYLHLGAQRVGEVSAPIAGQLLRVRPQLVLATESPA